MSVLLGCIADDFTGATDLAGTLVKAGMRSVQMIAVRAAIAESMAALSAGGHGLGEADLMAIGRAAADLALVTGGGRRHGIAGELRPHGPSRPAERTGLEDVFGPAGN